MLMEFKVDILPTMLKNNSSSNHFVVVINKNDYNEYNDPNEK